MFAKYSTAWENTEKGDLMQEILSPITVIDENRNYWLVRTQSGDYYDDFYRGGFIGIGWNSLDWKSIQSEPDEENVLEYIASNYPDEKQPKRILSQLTRFITDMSIGDIVLIPSRSSDYITFGEISSDVYEELIDEDEVFEGSCDFKRRRTVTWLKTVTKKKLDPYLYKLLNSHHTITNANNYDIFIDRTLHSFYQKRDTTHFVFEVNREKNIPTVELANLLNNLLDLVPEVNSLTGEDFKKEDLDVRLNLQSPGVVEIIVVVSPLLLLGVGVILHYIMGGSFTGKMSIKKEESSAELSSKTKGWMGMLKELREQKHRQKLEEIEAMTKGNFEKLKVSLPSELNVLPDPQNLGDVTVINDDTENRS
ncbi:hypothetical protein P4H71_04485 [Paenibacillus kribbensis]|uniref:hypothetical protein n=1 Tax=Paenibacillus kribbensis TaxID=172713 RepID=UPI002DB73618|nr:hypothetical protein [Paenibacillus kribbensis]MEC0233613.1 hypothetical protein [Paenibacillus kribbensis]